MVKIAIPRSGKAILLSVMFALAVVWLVLSSLTEIAVSQNIWVLVLNLLLVAGFFHLAARVSMRKMALYLIPITVVYLFATKMAYNESFQNLGILEFSFVDIIVSLGFLYAVLAGIGLPFQYYRETN